MTIPTSQLITMPEGKTLEFKRDISAPRNILKRLWRLPTLLAGVC